MAIDYTGLLTAEQKKQVIEQRVTQFAAEAYQHELNKQIAVQVNDTESVEKADAALAVLETAIATYLAEAETLGTE